MPELIADDGVRLNYATAGAGPVAVFYLHCLGADTTSWQGIWSALDHRTYRHVGVDLRGHGGSGREPCEITNDRIARDVLAVADRLGITRFALVGHSLGGKIGLVLAAMAPERISRLVLVGSPGPGLVPIGRELLEGFFNTYTDPAVTHGFMRPWFARPDRPEVEAYLQGFPRLPAWGLRAACEISLWTDVSARVGRLTVPTLVIAGANDPVYGPDYQRAAVLPSVPGARLVTVADCGHGLILEQPEEITHHLTGFLQA